MLALGAGFPCPAERPRERRPSAVVCEAEAGATILPVQLENEEGPMPAKKTAKKAAAKEAAGSTKPKPKKKTSRGK
jgi:hypothetical protein